MSQKLCNLYRGGNSIYKIRSPSQHYLSLLKNNPDLHAQRTRELNSDVG